VERIGLKIEVTLQGGRVRRIFSRGYFLAGYMLIRASPNCLLFQY